MSTFYPLDFETINAALKRKNTNGVRVELTDDRDALEYFKESFKTSDDLKALLVGTNCRPYEWAVVSHNHINHALLDDELKQHGLTYVCASARSERATDVLGAYHEVHPAVFGQCIVIMKAADKPADVL